MRVFYPSLLLVYALTVLSTPKWKKRTTVFDVTNPLGSILKNTTKIKYFIENLLEQNAIKEQKPFLLYNLDCHTLTDCADSFPKVENILTATTNRTDLVLILSITLPPNSSDVLHEIFTIKNLNFNWMLNFGVNLLVNFHRNTPCLEMYKLFGRFITLMDKLEPQVPGIGYNEDLIDCELFPHAWKAHPFAVVHYSFGSTEGITESFGVFQRRLSLLHSRQQEFIRKIFSDYTEIPVTLYYSTEENMQDICHQQLLVSYSEKLAKDESQDYGLIVPVPSFAISHQNPISKRYSMLANSINEQDFNSSGEIKEMSQRFNSVFIDYEHWKKVWTPGTGQHSLFEENLKNTSDIKLEVIIEFSEMKSETAEEAKLNLAEWQSKNPYFFVSTLLFHVKTDTVIIVEKFAEQMSSNFTMGCVIWQNFTHLNNSAALNVVNACNQINGSLYILKTVLVMDKKEVASQTYSFYYENTIRNELEQMKKIGQFILQRKPAARLVLNVQVIPKLMDDFGSVTNFCNDKLLYLNEYYEAITNWAICNKMETVLKSPIDDLTTLSPTTWLSYLRPIAGKSYELHKISKFHPYFVLRNYPNKINNWAVDPCIHWETVRPDVQTKYFNNSYIGAIIYTNTIRQHEAITVDEYKIMLQFVLYRFDIVEIVFQNSTGELVEACNWLESQTHLIDSNNKVLLNYQIPRSGNEPVRSTKELVLIFDELKENQCNFIKGIHFHFSTNGSSCLDHLSHPIFDTKVFLAEAQRINIKFGVVLDYSCCMDLINLLGIPNALRQPLLSFLEGINYLVCQENHKITKLDHMKTMGNVLDSQLYLKKWFQEFLPKLEFYSRVILTDLPSADSLYSDAYMKTVSHFIQFGTSYGIKYLIIEAFDGQTTNNGWWKIQNFSDLSNPLTFVEKEAESFNRITWRPEAIKKETFTDSVVNSQKFVLLSAGVLLILCLTLSVYYYVRYKKLRNFLSDEEVKEFLNGRSNGTGAGSTEKSSTEAEYMKFNTKYKLHISDLHIDIQTILGKGNFGTVYKGTVKQTPAAIKTPNKNCSKTCFKSVLCEVKVLCYIGKHSNIVELLGAYTNEIHRGVLYIATEFCANGSLEAFLRTKNNLVASENKHALLAISERDSVICLEDLCRFSVEIANGMEHLERKHVIHGDLAIRNVLLDENYTCKIADFGLSRKLYEYEKYVKSSQEPLPWKWMAYETLTKMEFTSKSDVWSYGVTVWEIFSLGKIPYSTLNWTLDFPDELKNGLRLNKPEYAPEEIYTKVFDCWNLDPKQRPSFTEILDFFKGLNTTEYIVLDEA